MVIKAVKRHHYAIKISSSGTENHFVLIIIVMAQVSIPNIHF